MILIGMTVIIRVIIVSVQEILQMKLEFFEACSRIDPDKLQEDRRLTNIAQILLSGEGYVTGAMRYSGADEKYISGDASDFEKFRELCRVYPLFEGNAAQYVCREILERLFEIKDGLCENNCEEIWKKTSDHLMESPITTTDLISRFDVSKTGILTDISADLSAFDRLSERVVPVLCPDSVFEVDRRGYKKKFEAFKNAFGENSFGIEKAFETLTEKFIKKGCSLAVLHGLTDGDLGKSDYYHAENAQKKAVETDGNIPADDARDFRRYACGKFLEICRQKRLDVLLEFSAPSLRILPDILVESPVERRIWLNFSGNEHPLVKDGFIDLRTDLQAQFSAYAKRYAIGNLPTFFVGTASPAELCLHGFYRRQLEKYLKDHEK